MLINVLAQGIYAALIYVGLGSVVVEGLLKYYDATAEPTLFNVGCIIFRVLLLAMQAVCGVFG